jgi:hypothetical protein
MPKRAELRQKAELYRRLASIPTEGGRLDDGVLLQVANELERQAAELEDRISRQKSPSTITGPWR